MKSKNLIAILLAATLLNTAGCDLSGLPSAAHDTGNQKAQTGWSSGIFGTEEWKEVTTGISQRFIRIDPGNGDALKDFFVVKVDPKKFVFGIYQNRDQDTAMTIEEIHKKTGSLLTFNGSFFTEDFKPTGLLISNGEKIRVASSADLLDGIFAIGENGIPKLFSNKASVNEKSYPFAIQNGPVLLDGDGKIMFDKETGKTASRTAIGMDSDDNVILIILKQSLFDADNHITLYEFSRMLKKSPGFKEMGLHSMLNLDGGPSTGLMVGGQYFPELDRVQNVVIVKARQV